MPLVTPLVTTKVLQEGFSSAYTWAEVRKTAARASAPSPSPEGTEAAPPQHAEKVSDPAGPVKQESTEVPEPTALSQSPPQDTARTLYYRNPSHRQSYGIVHPPPTTGENSVMAL